jgi:rhamnosyl/mannosyltransferase
MLKVLMFNKLYGPHLGGVERVVYDLCEEIQDKVKLTVLAANTKFRTEIERKNKYDIVRVASLGKIFSSLHLAISIPWWWKSIESDIVHFHFPSPIAELYCPALCSSNKPLVVSYHADIVGYKKALSFYAPFLKKFLERANRIIVSSPALLDRSRFLNKFKKKCVIIPFGIDIERFRFAEEVEEKAKEIRIKFSGRIILFVGRLVDYKGIDYLVHAMKDINATLLIVGNGKKETELKRLSGDLKISEKIVFVGAVTDKELSAYYHACDIFVLPSVNNKEEFGLVQLEAHACAKPVISTNLSTGVPFVNLDGITGFTVPPCSSAAVASAVNRLLKDEELRNRMGKQAKLRAESQFNRKIMADKVLDIYRDFFH